MSIVISDTSPIRALNHLGLLHILGQLFEKVLVPPAVVRELTQPQPRFDAIDLSRFAFVDVRAPRDVAQVQYFLQRLDAGESEALALALEEHAEALLIDESDGRAIAVQQGMSVIGTLGILSRAKNNGHIEKIGPLLDKLRKELDFYVSDRLQNEFLRSAGE